MSREEPSSHFYKIAVSVIFHILTIFPEYFISPLSVTMLRRSIESGVVRINLVDIRSYSTNKYRNVDDEIYGGGAGMLMTLDPVARAIKKNFTSGESKISIYLSPRGEILTQKICEELSKFKEILLLCGRYEGVDERIIERYIEREISIGDFVLPGGESAALLLMECVTRLIPGTVGKKDSVESDSITTGLLEEPHYTRPREWRGVEVPPVLLGGDHKKIFFWRKEQSLRITYERRPDLLLRKKLKEEEKKLLRKIWNEYWKK